MPRRWRYPSRMILRLILPVALVAFGPATAALADEPKRESALPGVDTTYSIVTPAPEPEPAPSSSGTTKLGKWELTVSGYVWVQVGTSSAQGD